MASFGNELAAGWPVALFGERAGRGQAAGTAPRASGAAASNGPHATPSVAAGAFTSGPWRLYKAHAHVVPHMGQTTFDDEELFGEATEDLRADIEESLAAARSSLPAADDVWAAEASNVLGVLNGLRSALDPGEAREHLRDAKKWYTVAERAEAFDADDDVVAEIEALEDLLATLADARGDVSDLAGTLPELKGALEEAREAAEGAGADDAADEADTDADGGTTDADEGSAETDDEASGKTPEAEADGGQPAEEAEDEEGAQATLDDD